MEQIAEQLKERVGNTRGGMLDLREEMFRAANEAELHGQSYQLNPLLLFDNECKLCGERLEAYLQEGKMQFSVCANCHPHICPRCGNRCETGQERRHGEERSRGFWKCISCSYIIPIR